MFSQIGQNWRGQPLTSYQVIVDLIASTTTSTGLKVYARLDETTYAKKLKVVGAASGHAGIVKASCVEGAGGARF